MCVCWWGGGATVVWYRVADSLEPCRPHQWCFVTWGRGALKNIYLTHLNLNRIASPAMLSTEP